MTPSITRRSALAAGAVSLLSAHTVRADDTSPPTLSAAPSSIKLADGLAKPADAWLLDGHRDGAVLRVKAGTEHRTILRNDTPKPLSLHWYGVRGPVAQDGVGGLTQTPAAPGGTFEYRLLPPEPGTYPIRPCVLGASGEAGGRGLCGMLIVEEAQPPAVDADLPLLVRDWLLTPDGEFQPFGRPEEAAAAGRLGNLMTVAGDMAPKRTTYPPGSRLRLRLVNGCNARIMRIRFENAKAYVAAVDGQPTETFEPLKSTLPFGPGSRYDVFLDVPAEPGAKASVVALVGPGLQLFEVTAGEGKPLDRPPVTALPPNRTLPPEIKLQNAVRATMTMTGGATRGEGDKPVYTGDPKAIWKVNGAAGSVGAAPLFSARRGQPVVLAFDNRTGFVQPIHLHGHVFRLLHAMDDGWEPYWLDTVQVPDGKTVHVAFMAENPGRWLVGSPVLERQDTGLWTTFEIE